MSVTVVGKEKDIRQLKATDIILSIDVDGLDEGEHRVPISIDHPEGVSVEGEIDDIVIEI